MKIQFNSFVSNLFSGINKIIYLSSLLLVAYPTFSQQSSTEAIPVSKYSIEEGLRQSMVKQVYQDSRGLLWMVTGDGLNCFDGQEFKLFRVPSKAPFTQHNNMMRCLVETEPNHFVVSSASSLCKFNSADAGFKIIIKEIGLHPVLFPFLIHKKPIAWIYNKGYQLINDTLLEPLLLEFAEGANSSLLSIPPLDAQISDDSTLFILTNTGLIEVPLKYSTCRDSYLAHWIPFKNPCQTMAIDTTGSLYVSQQDQIFKYLGNGQFEPYGRLSIDRISQFFIDSQNTFWMAAMQHRKLLIRKNGKEQSVNLLLSAGRHTDSLAPYVIDFFEDANQNIWIGTDGDGVLLYQRSRLTFQKASIGFTRCITSYNNYLLAGTFKNGLWQLRPDLLEAKRIWKDKYTNDFDILSITSDKLRRLWIISNLGLSIFEGNGKLVYNYPMEISAATVFEQASDTLLISTNNHLMTFFAGTKPFLLKKNIHYHLTSKIKLNNWEWVGTPFGLYRIDSRLGLELEQFSLSTKISSNGIKSLTGIDNEVWAATMNGIEIYNEEGRLIQLTDGLKPLQDELLYSLLADKKGRLWFSSNSGLGCYDTLLQKVIKFDSQHNLQSTEFNSNAYYQSLSGSLYFGGIQGINGFDPENFNPTPSLQKAALVSLYVSDSLYCKGIPPENLELHIGWRNPHIRGKVFSTHYQDFSDQAYSFCLINYEKQWSIPQNGGTFNYRNLPPGKYQLLVKYLDGNQFWSQPVELITITIRPPIWKTWWFLLIVAFTVFELVVFLVKQGQKKKYLATIKELEHQNAIEKERLRISRDLHDELGAGLSLILLNSSMAQSQAGQPEMVDSFLMRINRNTKELYESMHNLIWLLKTENQTMNALLAKLRETISELCEDAGLDYEISFPEVEVESIINRDASRQIYLMVKETVNNVIKHAQASKLTLNLNYYPERISIIVIDNGKGFDNKIVEKKGNGLFNLKLRAEHLNGEFKIQSDLGTGTRIEIDIPSMSLTIEQPENTTLR